MNKKQKIWAYISLVDLPEVLSNFEIHPYYLSFTKKRVGIVMCSVYTKNEISWINNLQGHSSNGLVRIEISPELSKELITWNQFKQKSKLPRSTLKRMEDAAKYIGASKNTWRFYLGSIRSKFWLRLEIWDGGQWNKLTSSTLKAEFIDLAGVLTRNLKCLLESKDFLFPGHDLEPGDFI